MKRIAIFASGSGSNAEAIARYFASSNDIEVACLVTNRAKAPVVGRMESLGIPVYAFGAEEWREAAQGGLEGANVVALMQRLHIDMIVLAGFLAYIPSPLVEAYRQRIINIHPSLLPRHGGKGMWGHHVHEAVLAAGDSVSGITIHQVTEHVDEGEILFQAECPVLPDDTPEALAQRIHKLEHLHFPQVIERLLSNSKL